MEAVNKSQLQSKYDATPAVLSYSEHVPTASGQGWLCSLSQFNSLQSEDAERFASVFNKQMLHD